MQSRVWLDRTLLSIHPTSSNTEIWKMIHASDKEVNLPVPTGCNLRRPAEGGEVLAADQQKVYWGIVGRLLHMTAWSRPDLSNVLVREVSRYGHRCTKTYLKALQQPVKYAWQTPKRGWFLKPTRTWNGFDKSFKFRISSKSDSSYATCVDTWKNVSIFKGSQWQ